MRAFFRAEAFQQVVEIFEQLKCPRRLSPAELKMVKVARRRVGG